VVTVTISIDGRDVHTHDVKGKAGFLDAMDDLDKSLAAALDVAEKQNLDAGMAAHVSHLYIGERIRITGPENGPITGAFLGRDDIPGTNFGLNRIEFGAVEVRVRQDGCSPEAFPISDIERIERLSEPKG
tara:strand:+ start:63 stop:452 length:390 start_codon:yes stop_codon:yes gene_type:complete